VRELNLANQSASAGCIHNTPHNLVFRCFIPTPHGNSAKSMTLTAFFGTRAPFYSFFTSYGSSNFSSFYIHSYFTMRRGGESDFMRPQFSIYLLSGVAMVYE